MNGREAPPRSAPPVRLILFDIDGTLLACGPQVRPIFASALVDVFGTTGDLDGFDFSGKTDPSIVLELMTGAGLTEKAIWEGLPRMREIYCRRLERGLSVDGMRLLPGVRELLDTLAGGEGATLGILTGNWHDGAQTKLSRYELGTYFDFGAFGDDGVARKDLVPVALDRARRATGRAFHAQETLVVGDSVRDVDCALANDAQILAVATGFTSVERLAGAGARWVARDLVEARREILAAV